MAKLRKLDLLHHKGIAENERLQQSVDVVLQRTKVTTFSVTEQPETDIHEELVLVLEVCAHICRFV